MKKVTDGVGIYKERENVTDIPEYVKIAKDMLQIAFADCKSEQLSERIQNIQIDKIENYPEHYIMYHLFYEKRTIEEECQPTGNIYLPDASERKHYKNEYEKWSVEEKEPVKAFRPRYERMIVPGSSHIENCIRCGARGYTPCTCGNGYETCSRCGGSGDIQCGTCGGSGKNRCSTCGGSGRTCETVTTYDSKGVPCPQDVYRTCWTCGGSGDVRCSNCGGSGYLTCGRCNGRGNYTCSKCNGTLKITCNTCQGGGHLLNQVVVTSETSTFFLYDCLISSGWTGEEHREYTTFVGEPEPSERDRLIIRVEADEPIHTIESEQLFANGVFDTDYLLEGVREEIPETEDVHYRQHAVEIWERDDLEITYTFGGKQYRMMTDPIKEVVCFEHNPIEDYANALVEQIESLYSAKEYKKLRGVLEDYAKAVAQSKTEEDQRVSSIRKKLKARVFGVGIILVLALICLFKLFLRL